MALSFQSTLPHGERREDFEITAINRVRFQSTLPHGERLAGYGRGVFIILFQSTLPHGERHSFHFASPLKIYFNPRSRTGSDVPVHAVYSILDISIHAPARGATLSKLMSSQCLLYFNPRSRTGSDLLQSHNKARSAHFNPRSRTGSDSKIKQIFNQ